MMIKFNNSGLTLLVSLSVPLVLCLFSFIILGPHSYSPYSEVSLFPFSGHRLYIKFMLVEELLTNPVLHVFVRLLRKGAEGGTVGKEAVNKQFFLRSMQSKEKLSFVYEEKGMR